MTWPAFRQARQGAPKLRIPEGECSCVADGVGNLAAFALPQVLTISWGWFVS